MPRSRTTRLRSSPTSLRAGLMKKLLALAALLLTAVPASAQPRASLRVTVVDQTGAAIVGASVRVTSESGSDAVLSSNDRGQAVVTDLVSGRVQLRVETSGFAPHDAFVNLRRGNNNQTVTLRIASLQEQLVVTDRDAA